MANSEAWIVMVREFSKEGELERSWMAHRQPTKQDAIQRLMFDHFMCRENKIMLDRDGGDPSWSYVIGDKLRTVTVEEVGS